MFSPAPRGDETRGLYHSEKKTAGLLLTKEENTWEISGGEGGSLLNPGTDFGADHPRPLVTDMLKRRGNINLFDT